MRPGNFRPAETRYFIVHNSCSIGGHPYRPGVCYVVPSGSEETIKTLEKEGHAKLFDKEVRIVTGRIVEPSSPAPARRSIERVVRVEQKPAVDIVAGKAKKKKKRDFD